MRRYNSLCLAFLLASTLPALAQSATDPGTEIAFMPRTMSVTLLNDGGKYVAIDLKHIPQGGTCRMDQDATIVRVGPGASEGLTVRSRKGVPTPRCPATSSSSGGRKPRM